MKLLLKAFSFYRFSFRFVSLRRNSFAVEVVSAVVRSAIDCLSSKAATRSASVALEIGVKIAVSVIMTSVLDRFHLSEQRMISLIGESTYPTCGIWTPTLLIG